MKKIGTAFISILAVGAILFVIGKTYDSSASGSASTNAAAKRVDQGGPATDRAIDQASSAPANVSPSRVSTSHEAITRDLQRALSASRDWRLFALTALKAPEHGGYFYAMYVTNLCGRNMAALSADGAEKIRDRVAATGTLSPEVVANVECFATRCASFASGEAVDMFRSTRALSANGRDPLVNAQKSVLASLATSDQRSIRTSVSSLLEIGDPLILSQDELLARIMTSNQEKGSGDYWFNGKVYGFNDPDELSAFLFATQLAGCQTDSPCGIDDTIMLACISGGDCQLDRVNDVHDSLKRAGISDTAFQKFDSLRQQMAEAISTRNDSAFVK